MELPTTDRDLAVEAGARALGRFAELLRSGVDPNARVSAEWSVHDVAAHVVVAVTEYAGIVRGCGSPIGSIDGIADFNADSLARVDESDLAAIADAVDFGAKEVAAAAAEGAANRTVPWHGGLVLPVAAVAAMMIGEGYVHGYDVARATGRRWDIPADDARTLTFAMLPIVPAYVDEQAAAGVRATYEVRLRGTTAARWLMAFDDGAVEVAPTDGRPVDCRLSADPVAFVLTSYGRLSPLAAAARGRVVAWGRKPWLGFKLTSLLRNP